MKWVNLFLLLTAAFTPRHLIAQTNESIPFLTIDGQVHTNVPVLRANPAYIIVDSPEGITRVATSNLPPELQRRFHYSPEAAAEFLSTEKQKAAAQHAAYETQAAAAAQDKAERQKKAQWIYIIEIAQGAAQPRASAIVGGKTNSIYLRNPPAGLGAAIQQFFWQQRRVQFTFMDASYKGDPQAIAEARASLKELQRRLPRVHAFDTGTLYANLPVWQCVP